MKTYHQDGNHRKNAFSGLQRDYEAARPKYPIAALELIKQHCRSPSLICDIGCGTGKLTRQLGAGEAKQAGFRHVTTKLYPWVRKISSKSLEQMARSSTRYQAALNANPEASETALNTLLSTNGDANGQITVEYEPKIVSATLCSKPE
jgi:hypothetical protein